MCQSNYCINSANLKCQVVIEMCNMKPMLLISTTYLVAVKFAKLRPLWKRLGVYTALWELC